MSVDLVCSFVVFDSFKIVGYCLKCSTESTADSFRQNKLINIFFVFNMVSVFDPSLCKHFIVRKYWGLVHVSSRKSFDAIVVFLGCSSLTYVDFPNFHKLVNAILRNLWDQFFRKIPQPMSWMPSLEYLLKFTYLIVRNEILSFHWFW